VPVRAAAVAGLLPPADGAAGARHACGRGPAPRGRSGHPAPAAGGGAAAPLLDPDAGDLAAAVALRPAQAGGAPARAPALPRRVRLPGPARGRLAGACRGRRLLARGPGRPGAGRERRPGRRGRRGRGASRAPPPPAPAQRQPGGVMAIPVTAAIGLGGNIGDAAATLREALQALDALPRTRLLRASSLYRTPAWGNTEQDDFINAVALLQTELDARALLDALLEVELRFGRDRAASPPWGPRTL